MKIVNISDLENAAREILPPLAWDYISGGAEDEYTVAENRQAFQRIKLRPRALRDVSTRDLSTEVFGQRISLPVLLGPTSPQRLAHPDAEIATARAAALAGTISICSTDSHFSIEEVIAATTGPVWFQLYCYENRNVVERLVRRVEAAGCQVLVLTVDADYPSRRERMLRNPLTLSADIRLGNLTGIGLDEMLLYHETGVTSFLDNLEAFPLTWNDLAWLRSITKLPIVLKGLLTAEDAALAVEHGVNGIIVSNHGGRQVDTAVASIEALPEIVEQVGGQLEVFLDGGIRRGTDVLKALALGAKAVLLGRAYLWGLAVNGEVGVRQVIEMLREEIDCAMTQLGRPTIQSVDRSLVALPYAPLPHSSRLVG